jgi:hypothetical protein
MTSKEVLYLRNPASTLVGNDSNLISIRANGSVHSFSGSVRETYVLIQLLTEPRSLSEITNALGCPAEQTKRILRRLETEGIIVSGAREALRGLFPSRRAPSDGWECDRLVFCISGTIHAAWILNVPFMLKGTFAREVDVVLTKSARKFIRPEIISFFGLRVWSDPFEATPDVNVPHIWLASKADIVLILPASAHTIQRLATGACSDLTSLIATATKAPVVVAPSMNLSMLSAPCVQRNIAQLRRDGYYALETGLGFEVSNTADGVASFGGIGLGGSGIASVLRAVLRSHRLCANGRGSERLSIHECRKTL